MSIHKLVFINVDRGLTKEEKEICNKSTAKADELISEFKKNFVANNPSLLQQYSELERKYESDSNYYKAVWNRYVPAYVLRYYYQSVATGEVTARKNVEDFNNKRCRMKNPLKINSCSRK